MAKFIKLKTIKKEDNTYRVTGIIGKNEKGDDIAHANYMGSGGLAHHPEPDENGLLIPLDSGRFHVVVGGRNMSIALKEGESAFFSIKNGIVQAQILAKGDGTLHLNGNSNSATLFEPLAKYLNNLQFWLNTHSHPEKALPATKPFTDNASRAQSFKVKLG